MLHPHYSTAKRSLVQIYVGATERSAAAVFVWYALIKSLRQYENAQKHRIEVEARLKSHTALLV